MFFGTCLKESEREREISKKAREELLENGILGSEANLLHGCICVTEE